MNENFLKLVQKINEIQATINILSPNFIRITSGTCESFGYQELHSPNECSLAGGGRVGSQSSNSSPNSCFEYVTNGETQLWYNSVFSSTVPVDSSTSYVAKWCKE